MRAVQVTGYGGIEQLETVTKDVPIPKANEVLVKVKACAINNTEIWMREGAYGAGSASGWRPEGVSFPRIPGSDISGTIVDIGQSVNSSMKGKNVVLFPFTSSGDHGSEHIADDMAFIGSEYDGGYADYVVWPAELCFNMPLSDYTESAVFTVSGLTAWHMNEQLDIQPSETIMVTGANGGVGSLNVQIAANVFSANVIAIVRDLDLDGDMKRLGATHVFSYQSDQLVDDIIDINGGPIDSVLDVVGDPLFSASLEALKKGGKFCISGSAGGQTTNLDFRSLYLNHITMYGSVLGTRDEYRRMLQAISDGQIKPVIDRTFPLEKAHDAQQYFKESGKLGKVVLLPDEKTL